MYFFRVAPHYFRPCPTEYKSALLRTNTAEMALLLLIGVITICATVGIDAGLSNNNKKDVCPSEHITFRLQTSTDDDGFVVTESDIDNIPLPYYGELKVMMHGYKGNEDYNPNSLLVPACIKKNYTVLIVEWNKTDSNCTEIYDILIAGICTAHLLHKIYAKGDGYYWEARTHIIGFSLGAHAAGIAGYYLPNLPRITGLDPARIELSEYIKPPKYRLDHSDAKLVDVYHTNGGKFGSLWPSGDVDFYINNGISQPGCDTDSCSHFRSVEVFAESIGDPTAFYGEECKTNKLSCLTVNCKEICAYVKHSMFSLRSIKAVYAGDPITIKPERTTYRFETNGKAPFGKGAP